jgi:hypothetical protein
MRVVVTTAAAAALLTAVAMPAGARIDTTRPGTWCGGTLWRLMTLSDTSRYSVGWAPSGTSVGAIAKLPAPARIIAARSTIFQKHLWQIQAVIERYRVASNGEIVLQLFDITSATYMNAYMPSPKCLSSSTRERAQIVAARNAFVDACPAPQVTWQLLGATAKLTGVGFWNPVKTTAGALPNGAELRPLTGFELLNGCGKG